MGSSLAGKVGEGLNSFHHERTKMLRSILRGLGAGRFVCGRLGLRKMNMRSGTSNVKGIKRSELLRIVASGLSKCRLDLMAAWYEG
jgi:hypothetical protein